MHCASNEVKLCIALTPGVKLKSNIYVEATSIDCAAILYVLNILWKYHEQFSRGAFNIDANNLRIHAFFLFPPLEPFDWCEAFGDVCVVSTFHSNVFEKNQL